MNNEEKIMSMLETLTTTVTQMRTDIQDLKQGQAKLEAGQVKLEAKVDGLETRFDKLEAKVDRLDTKVDGLNKEVGVLTQCANESYQDQRRFEQSVNSKLDELKELTKLKTDFSVLKSITADNMYDIKALKLANASNE